MNISEYERKKAWLEGYEAAMKERGGHVPGAPKKRGRPFGAKTKNRKGDKTSK